jgi:iduronate 2-sulfatase
MLTSRSPDTTKVYQNHIYWRESAGPFTTLPEYFKDNGYKTYSIGKVFHIQGHRHRDDPISWSTRSYQAPVIRHIRHVGANWVPVTEKERHANPLEDERLVAHATNVLKRFVKKSKEGHKKEPFFMAVGFYRPHVPMICPEEFFKMYPLEAGKQYMSQMSWQTPSYEQFQNMAPFEPGTTNNAHLSHIPDMALRYLRRSYFACVSYVDHLVGILLKTLDDLALRNSTVVALVADHGFQLGENNIVSKYTNNELSVRVPLMIRVPGLTDAGIESRSLVELLDVFPTIAAAAGLPVPPPCPERSTDIRLCTEGQNLLSLVSVPDLTLREAAYSQIFRGIDLMEYSIRTDRMRYTDFATYKR